MEAPESSPVVPEPALEIDKVQDEKEPIPLDVVIPKKKRKNRKPKSKSGKNKPTGFEGYFADAPMTPDEYNEEIAIYDVSRPIIHRMDDAILRYQKNRRILPDRRDIFMKYLAYGGVNVDQKMFGSVDQRELKDMSNEEILQIKGQTSIEDERSNMLIDFDAVVRGYLTSYFPHYFNPDTEEMVNLATVTIRNFLSYLLYHDVCPEYKKNIDTARTSCDIASKELWNNQQFTSQGPGDFNRSCSTLFGGVFFNDNPEANKWKNERDPSVQLTNDIARKVVKLALAGAGSNTEAIRFKELANDNALRAMRIEDIDGFEVTAITPPDPGVLEFYKSYASDLRPVGKMAGKPFRDPRAPALDLSPEEREQWDRDGMPQMEFEFFLEESLLELCYPGMKVVTTVFELNCGLHFFDSVNMAYSSIYTVLANDLMLGWKKPKDLTGGDGEVEDSGGEEDDAGKKPEELVVDV
ncbi:hypothetical protein PHISCL_10012 [Aspergillus sclerotialis]|uniref:Argonaute complex, subunit Arb1 n=1 Tax=Aspergillus sclerotialis TaxID=2070753 RepID=A0A3A2ZKG6_9EURO|nr:hypothetical protein PHISCL_10012 [Aspergillus sclerotialis]